MLEINRTTSYIRFWYKTYYDDTKFLQ